MKFAELKILKLKSEFFTYDEDTQDKLLTDKNNLSLFSFALSDIEPILSLEQHAIGVIMAQTKSEKFYLPFKNDQFTEALTFIRNLSYE